MKQYSIYIQKKNPIVIYANDHKFSHDGNTLILSDDDNLVAIFNWNNIGGFEVVNLPRFAVDEEYI